MSAYDPKRTFHLVFCEGKNLTRLVYLKTSSNRVVIAVHDRLAAISL